MFIDVFLLVFINRFNFILVFYMLLLILFRVLSSYAWGGLFLIFDSFSFILLLFLRLFIFAVVLWREKNSVLCLLSEVLIFFCLLFFVPGSLILLYMFFELSIFPILVIILGYGRQIEKVRSAYYLIVYAAFCSLPFLFIYFKNYYFFSLVYFNLFFSWELIFVLSLSFIIKFPVYFLHLWLPKAHVEAPTTASMLLAGLLLKLGTVGFLRIIIRLNFNGTEFWVLIAFLGIILAAFMCCFQRDAKALAAYSSVTHISFLLMTLSFLILRGKTRRLIIMLSHGYTSTLIFYLIGEFYHVSLRRMVYYIGGFFSSSMFISLVFCFVFLSNIGVPPSLSFLSEFVGVSSAFNMFFCRFWLVFVYFFVAFYYSIYILTSALIDKVFINFGYWRAIFSVPLVYIMFNIFWVSLIL